MEPEELGWGCAVGDARGRCKVGWEEGERDVPISVYG